MLVRPVYYKSWSGRWGRRRRTLLWIRVMGKGRRAIKIGKKKQGVFVGSKREIVTTMDPVWFVVQSLIFSSDGFLGIAVPLMTTTVTMELMEMLSNGSTNFFISSKCSSQLLLEWRLLAFCSQKELRLFPSSGPCQQSEGAWRRQLVSYLHRIQWYHPPISHSKLELFVTGQIFCH